MENQSQRFVVNPDGTVADHQLKLRWTQATVAKNVDVDEAEEVLKGLGEKFGGTWRFASVQEMFSLVDHTHDEPAINTDIFPDTESDWYWTGTPTAWNKPAVWVVHFYLGLVRYGHRGVSGCLRAVSELPAGQ